MENKKSPAETDSDPQEAKWFENYIQKQIEKHQEQYL